MLAGSSPTSTTAAAAQPTLLWYKKDLRLDDHPGWHQALAAATSGAAGPVVPVFVFDPARYAALVLPPGGAEGERGAGRGRGRGPSLSLHRTLRVAGQSHLVCSCSARRGRAPTPCPCLPPAAALCRALASLDRGLRQRGSALLVRVGAWEEELPGLVQELGAGGVVAEQEVEAGAWGGWRA